MENLASIFGALFLLGSIQGVVLSLYLFFQRNKPRFRGMALGLLVLILAYDLFETFFSTTAYFSLFFRLLAVLFTFGMGPCVYIYVRLSLRPDGRLPTRISVYFAPLIIQALLRLIVFGVFLYDKPLGNSLYLMHLRISAPLSVIVFWCFLIWSWKEYKDVSSVEAVRHIEEVESHRWIGLFLLVVASITILWTIMIFWSAFFPASFHFTYFYPLQIILIGFIYGVGFKSFERIRLIHVSTGKNSQAFFESIPEEDVMECAVKLRLAMEVDQLYTDPELSLVSLAKSIGVRPKIVSSVLNRKFDKGFNEFVNEFRVEAAKEKLLNGDRDLNVTEIAFVSGFNSIATFQRAFKAHTAMSPKAFLAAHKNL